MCCSHYYRHANMSNSFMVFVTFGSVTVKRIRPKAAVKNV